MDFYIASGTYDFMKKIFQQKKTDNMILMQNASETLLIQESSTKSVFSSPRKYTIIEAYRELLQQGVAILAYVYVDHEDRPAFEEEFPLQMKRALPGLIAYRFLRPVTSDSYLIYTQWESTTAAELWSDIENQLPEPSIVKHANVFVAKNYTKKYNVPKDIS